MEVGRRATATAQRGRNGANPLARRELDDALQKGEEPPGLGGQGRRSWSQNTHPLPGMHRLAHEPEGALAPVNAARNQGETHAAIVGSRSPQGNQAPWHHAR